MTSGPGEAMASTAAIYVGAVVGAVIGALVGALVDSWSGVLIGAYGGVICGMCVIGGIVNRLPGVRDQAMRADAAVALSFGIFAVIGAVAGYWVGTMGVPMLSPYVGFFVGLLIPGQIAGWVTANRTQGDAAILLLLACALMGAGCGGYMGTVLGNHPLLGAGLVVGSVLGGVIGHAINEGIERAVNPGYNDDDWFPPVG
jgi:hypothetical protein